MNPENRRPKWQERKIVAPERDPNASAPQPAQASEPTPVPAAEQPEPLLEAPEPQPKLSAPAPEPLLEAHAAQQTDSPVSIPETDTGVAPAKKSPGRAWLLILWPIVLLALAAGAYYTLVTVIPANANNAATQLCQNATTDCVSDSVERSGTPLKTALTTFLIASVAIALSIGLYSIVRGIKLLRAKE